MTVIYLLLLSLPPLELPLLDDELLELPDDGVVLLILSEPELPILLERDVGAEVFGVLFVDSREDEYDELRRVSLSTVRPLSLPRLLLLLSTVERRSVVPPSSRLLRSFERLSLLRSSITTRRLSDELSFERVLVLLSLFSITTRRLSDDSSVECRERSVERVLLSLSSITTRLSRESASVRILRSGTRTSSLPMVFGVFERLLLLSDGVRTSLRLRSIVRLSGVVVLERLMSGVRTSFERSRRVVPLRPSV